MDSHAIEIEREFFTEGRDWLEAMIRTPGVSGCGWTEAEWIVIRDFYDGRYKMAQLHIDIAPGCHLVLKCASLLFQCYPVGSREKGTGHLDSASRSLLTSVIKKPLASATVTIPTNPAQICADLIILTLQGHEDGKWSNSKLNEVLACFKALELRVQLGKKASIVLMSLGLYVLMVWEWARSSGTDGLLFSTLQQALQIHHSICRRNVDFLNKALEVISRQKHFRPPPPVVPPLTFDTLGEHFFGQKKILADIAKIFLARKMEVMPIDKPLVLWFSGLSGHGKSQLAKLIASCMHDTLDPERDGKLISLHMPNFSSKESSYSLIDPPVAHVGDGILLSKLWHGNDNAVVLLDEFDKVENQTVNDIWLAAFQKQGMLKSLKSYDRSVSTVRTVFIITSNIGQELIEADQKNYVAALQLGHTSVADALEEKWKDFTMKTIRTLFGDPLINRIDQLFVFTPYTFEEKIEVVHKQLMEIVDHTWEVKGRRMILTNEFESFLACSISQFHSTSVKSKIAPFLMEAEEKNWDSFEIERKLSITGEVTLHAVRVDDHEDNGGAPPPKVTIPGLNLPRLPGATITPSPRLYSNDTQNLHVGGGGGGGRDSARTQGGTRMTSLHMDLETQLQRVKDLEQEVLSLKDVIKAKDMDIQTLTKTVKQLRYALAIVCTMMLATTMLLSLFIPIKIIALTLLLVVAGLAVLIKNFLAILTSVLGILWTVLGPRWFILIVLFVCARIYLGIEGFGC